jgi:cytochrome c oxidase cbb3-type subunit I/II
MTARSLTESADSADMYRKVTVRYDDRITQLFSMASVVWGLVGLSLGALIALQLAFWQANLGPYLTFGRLRPLHTNAVIFRSSAT